MEPHDNNDDSGRRAEPPKQSEDSPKPIDSSKPAQHEWVVSEEFAKYMTPEFTERLIEHMFRAKKVALREMQDNPPPEEK